MDDQTYNLLQALTSKLEAIEAYGKYSAQDQEGLFAQLRQDDARHAERLVQALGKRLGGASQQTRGSQGEQSTGSTGSPQSSEQGATGE